jgi:thiol-disulfide isomerase/thioredoxin
VNKFKFFFIVSVLGIVAAFSATISSAQISRYQSWDDLISLSARSPYPVVVNFWATWCRPCVEELPEFFALCNEHADSVKVVLVNMDFESKVASVVVPFLRRRNFSCEVARLPGHLEDTFIQKVSASWSGALPFTLILKNGISIYEKEDSITAREILAVIRNKQ